MRPADRAWLVIGAGVLAYEIAARDGELLSEAADRYMLTHPWLTRAVVASVAVHLCNAIPQRFDVLHWIFVTKNQLNHKGD